MATEQWALRESDGDLHKKPSKAAAVNDPLILRSGTELLCRWDYGSWVGSWVVIDKTREIG